MMTLAVLSLLVALVLFSMLFGVILATVWAVGRIRRGEAILPEAPERSVPWGFGSVVLVILLWVAFNVGIAEVYAMLTRDASTTRREFGLAEIMLIATLANGGLLLTVPMLLKLTSGARVSDIGIDPRGLLRQVGLGAGAFLVVSPFVYAFNLVAALIWKATPHKLELLVRSDRSEDVVLLAIVSAVVLAPAAEELIFRGVLQSWLRQFFGRLGQTPKAIAEDSALPVEAIDLQVPAPEPTEFPEFAPPASELAISRDDLVGPSWFRLETAELLAILGSSAIFAAVHLPQWPAPLALFVLSLGLGLVYRRTGSLIAVVVMHAMFNGLGTLLLYWALQLGDFQAKNAKPPASCVVCGKLLEGFSQRPEVVGPR